MPRAPGPYDPPVSAPPENMIRPRNLGLLAAAIITFVLGLIVLTEGGEPVALVFPGERVDGPLVEEFGRDAIPERFPYDGTRTYQLAKHFPDLEAAYDDGVADFRMTRVLQASIASIFGTGNPVLLALAALSVVGVGIATWSLSDLALRHGRDPRVGLAALLALALPAAITTTEPLAFGLALAGLAMFDRDRLIVATCLFGAAGLGRETALAAAVAAALVLLARRQIVAAAAVAILSAAPYVIWAAYVSSRIPATHDPTTQFLGFLHIPDAVGRLRHHARRPDCVPARRRRDHVA